MSKIIIGKRINIGAVISGIAAIFAHFIPQHAAAIVAAVIPITYIVQVIVVNKYGVTTK